MSVFHVSRITSSRIMKPYPSLKHIIAELLPLHRTIVSDDMDKTLDIIGGYLPDQANYATQTYAPGSKIWTWEVPERYIVHEAYLETEDGKKIVNFADNPLHIISYSLPIDKILTFDELNPHLRYSENFPDALPWEFKYYERDWGFCLTKNAYDALNRDSQYHAVIRVDFARDPELGLRIGHGVIHPEGGRVKSAGEIIVQAHSCHPMQANDDLAGVVSTIEVAKRLAENPLPEGSMSVRFWFGPETIGTIAYLANNEDLIPNLQGGIFMEMTGNKNTLAWHHSRQHMTNTTPPATISTSWTKKCSKAQPTSPKRLSASLPLTTSPKEPFGVPFFSLVMDFG